MSLLPNVDPDGLLEYSVVFTDRSLNHMSGTFQKVMNDISSSLKSVYKAHSVAIVPGSTAAPSRERSRRNACLLSGGWRAT